MSDKDHPTTEYDDYGSENNYDTGYDDGIESDGYTSEDYESGEYESDDNETGDYASDDYDAEYSDSDSYASDDYDAEDGDPEYYDSEQYAASDYDDAYDQGEYDVESADPATIDPDTIPPEALEPYYDKLAFKWLKNMNRAKLIRLVSMLIFSVAILVFASIAWFTMNKDVGTGGMSIQIATSPFELKTIGYYGYYDDYLGDEVEKIADDLSTAGLPPSGTHGELTTSGNTIQWLITDTYNAQNYVTESTNDDDKGIRPGTSGEMKFWVVSKESLTITISFRLNVIPYKTNYILDESGNYVFSEGASSPDEGPPISIATDANYTIVRNYLFSHILFFKSRTTVETTSGSSYYTYSDLISLDNDFSLVYDSVNNVYTSTLSFDIEEGIIQDKPLSIYWVWPETLAEAVLPENMQESGHHAVCTGDEIINKLKANPAYFLKDYNAAADTNNTANEDLTKEIIKQYYPRLSLEYNNADQDIGDNVGYILLSLTAI